MTHFAFSSVYFYIIKGSFELIKSRLLNQNQKYLKKINNKSQKDSFLHLRIWMSQFWNKFLCVHDLVSLFFYYRVCEIWINSHLNIWNVWVRKNRMCCSTAQTKTKTLSAKKKNTRSNGNNRELISLTSASFHREISFVYC